jgi:hypothetical protein
MSAPQRAGRSVDIRLVGYVTLQDVCSHVGEIWKQARQQKGILFALDCSTVLDFSSLALTALGRLRRHLREFGCDLILAKCSSAVLDRKDDPAVAALLVAELSGESQPAVTDDAQTHPAPTMNRLSAELRSDSAHSVNTPHYIQRLGGRFQRYWLN